MADYDNTNTGTLWKNDKGGNERRPDRTGTINVDGVYYNVSGWLKKTKDGRQFLSMQIQKRDKQPPREGIIGELAPPMPPPRDAVRSLFHDDPEPQPAGEEQQEPEPDEIPF